VHRIRYYQRPAVAQFHLVRSIHIARPTSRLVSVTYLLIGRVSWRRVIEFARFITHISTCPPFLVPPLLPLFPSLSLRSILRFSWMLFWIPAGRARTHASAYGCKQVAWQGGKGRARAEDNVAERGQRERRPVKIKRKRELRTEWRRARATSCRGAREGCAETTRENSRHGVA